MHKIFFNGAIIAEADAHISLQDRGFTLGDGLFETIRIYQGKAVFLADHWRRLQNGLNVLKMSLPYSQTDIAAAIPELLAANQCSDQDVGIRLMITRGPAPRGILPPANAISTVILTVVPYVPPPATSTAFLSAIRRNEYSPLVHIKTVSYLDNIFAQQEAVAHGADDAILMNTRDFLVEASIANLFIVRNKQLFTPPSTDGALPGVTRHHILRLAQQLKLPAHEASLTCDDLFQADEAFLTGSLRGITALVKVSNRPIADGRIGALTQQLQGAFQSYVQTLMSNS